MALLKLIFIYLIIKKDFPTVNAELILYDKLFKEFRIIIKKVNTNLILMVNLNLQE